MNGRDMDSTWTRNPSVRVGVGRLAPLSSRPSVKCYSIRHCGIAARKALDPDTALVRLVIGKNRWSRRPTETRGAWRGSRAIQRVVEGDRKLSPLVGPTLRATHVDQTVEMFADGGSIPPASTNITEQANRPER